MTDPTRDLIRRMADMADALDGRKPLVFAQGQAMDGFTALANFQALANEARAYLSQPEPEGLTDEEILNLSQEHGVSYIRPGGELIYPYQDATDMKDDVLSFARALIAADRARCGRPAVEPVPVSERPILKSSNFNDANGHCWCGTRASIDKTGDLPVKMPSSWELRESCAQDDCVLPHYALPIPTTTTETP